MIIRTHSLLQINKQIVLYFFLATLFITRLLFAQRIGVGNYQLAHYTTGNGLPQNSVNGMVMDENGFLWLATEAGLVRFDGQRFQTFDKSILGMNVMRLSNIQLSLDSINMFYVCAEKFEYFSIQNGKPQTSKYRATLEKKGEFKIDDQDEFYVFPGIPKIYRREFTTKNFIIPRGGNGNYFKLDSKDIIQYRNWKKELTFPHKGGNFLDYFRHGSQLFYVDERGNLSYFTTKGVNVALEFSGDIVSNKDFVKGRKNFQIFLNDFSDQFFVSLGTSIYLVSFNEQQNKVETKLLFTGFDCYKNDILSAHYDQENRRLFLGSFTDGLFVLTTKNFTAITSGKYVKDNVFYSQVNFDRNSVFVRQGAILGINEADGRLISKRTEKWVEGQSSEDKLTSHIVDENDCIWDVKDELLRLYNRNGKEMLREWKLASKIGKLYSYDGKEIWIATRRAGLYKINVNEQRLNQIVKEDKSTPPVAFVQMDPENKKLWIGTEDGLYWMDKETRKKEGIKEFNGVHIRSIYFSNQNEIWIASYKHGFWLIKDDKVTRFPLDKNNDMTGVHCIVEDRNGFLWLPTNKGLYQVAKTDLMRYHNSKSVTYAPFYYYYGYESGFNTDEFNGGCLPCAVRTGNDYISLPSMNGLVWFKPEKINRELPKGEIFIDDYRVNNTFFKMESDTITLPIDPTSFEVTISTPFFGNKNNLTIDYVLSGEALNTNISGQVDMTGERTAVSFSHLHGGSYKLVLKLANGSFKHPFTTKEIVVISPLHFYETTSFRIVLLLFSCVLVLFLIWIRTRRIKRRNELLEKTVLQRTEELQNTLAVLRDSDVDLQNKISQQSRIIASISHDINTPLRYHTVLVEHCKKMLMEMDLKGLETVHETLGASTNQLTTLTNNLLEYIKVQNFESTHSEELVSLHDIVQQKIELFRPILKVRNNVFVNELVGEFQVRSNPVLLGIIIHNLLDNAYKFTHNGIIRITAEKKEENTTLTIYNTQGGMPAETIEWLTSTTKRQIQSSVSKNGLGLVIVKEMAAIINIRISIIAREKETAISLWFSNNISHYTEEDPSDESTVPETDL